MKKLLLLLLTFVACIAAQATVQTGILIQGMTRTNGSTSMCVCAVQTQWGGDQTPLQSGSSYTFNNQTIAGVTLNGTLNFQVGTSAADVITGSSFTVTIESSTMWFLGASVQTKSGTAVSGCSNSVSSNKHTLTVTIPSGKTFGQILIDYVPNEPISSSNTVISGLEDSYLYLGAPIEPEPTVTYNGRALTKDTDYTLSYWGSNKVGEAQLTVTGTGNYAGDIRKNYTIRKVALTDFNSLGNNTYEIATTTDLDYLALYINDPDHGEGVTFKQTADIAYSYTNNWDQGGENNFTAIGGYSNSFRGTYDGQNHTISGIRIYKNDTTNYDGSQGLFGFISSSAIVKNVTLADANIVGHKNTGGIVGYCSGNIENCQVESNVYVNTVKETNSLGGIAGICTDGHTINRCTFKGIVRHNVSNSTNIGGIVGTLNNSTVSNCLALEAHVSGTTYSGAIVGNMTGTRNTLTANYYHDCTVINKVNSGESINVGVGIGNGSEDQAGARSVHALTLPDGVTATGESVVIDSVTHCAANTTVTLACVNVPAGYSLLHFIVDGTPIEGDTFTMPAADAAVTVQFVPIDYTITLPSGLEHATVTSDKATAHIGDTVTLTVTPDEEWSIASVIVMNGNTPLQVTAGENNTYTFVMPAANVTVAVETKRFRYIFNSETGMLKLIYGEFNQGNKWGDEVTALEVTSVKATDEVSFTGNCSRLFIGFSHCTSMDLSKVTTTNISNTNQMFANCSSLDTLDLSGWNTSSVTNMGGMFNGCSNLTTLNLTGWDVSKVTEMGNIFNNCRSLDTLDLSDWNTIDVTNMGAMFRNCINLTTIYAGEGWNTETVTSSYSMFVGDTKLVGGMGTTFDVDHSNSKEYARYDRGEDEHGYLTGVFTLTLPEDVATTTAATLTHGDVNLYAGGTEVALTYSGEVPYGYKVAYKVNGDTIEGNSFAMPFEGATIEAFMKRLRYVYDSEKGTLALLYGEFSRNNKWGGEVNPTLVTSITATDEVSFTGDCSSLFAVFMNCKSIDLSNVNTDGVTDMNHMFVNCNNLETLDLTGWNTSSVTDMGTMFYRCVKLSAIAGISEWNTANVTNMSDMFMYCDSLETLDISGWDVGKVTSMNQMFYNDKGLTSLNLVGWNTAKVTDMRAMFQQCSNLAAIYADNSWSNDSVSSSGGMFYGCTALAGGMGTAYSVMNLDASYARLDHGEDEPGYLTGVFTLTLPENVTTKAVAMLTHGDVNLYAAGDTITLAYCGEVPEHSLLSYSVNGTAIEGDSFVMPFEAVTVTATITAVPRYTFDSATGTLALNWGEFNKDNKWGNDVDIAYVTSVTATDKVRFTGDCSGLFNSFYQCNSFDLNKVNTDSVTDMSEMFVFCQSVKTLDLSGWNVSNVTDMESMFYNSNNLKTLDASGWNTASVTNMSSMFYSCSSFETLDLSGWNTGNVTDMNYMFFHCSSLESLNLLGWNTGNVTNMERMFNNCDSLKILDLSGWNTSKVTDMNHMFSRCSSLESLNLLGWNTGNVTNMEEMFYSCDSLTTIYFGDHWSTASVTDMSYMFGFCSSLDSLDIAGWNTCNVTDMSGMFYKCNSLKTLDLSGWNTGNVTNMGKMFNNCSSLKTLNLSGWNTGNVTNMETMFQNCSSLTTIYVGDDWSTASVISSYQMFDYCYSLVGGMGTAYNKYFIGLSYARYDKGVEEPGYFSGLFSLTLPEDVTASPAATFTRGDVAIYTAGTKVTLTYGGEVPEGYSPRYSLNGNTFGGDSFVMPYEDATVTVEVQPTRYTYDPETGVLALLWGEFNKDDKWGDEVPIADVTIVTATDEVSFTGNCSSLFSDFTNCKSMDLTGVNTSAMTNAASMFAGCSILTTIEGLSDFDMGNVTDMTSMFVMSHSLESLDISGWDVGNVTNMTTMFGYCDSLKTLDLSGWNTGNVTDMANMFIGCINLETLNLSGWDVSNAISMWVMFNGCSSLTTLDVSNWAIGSADFTNLFLGCTGITTLDLSTWNTLDVTSMAAMFINCTNLTTIYVGEGWSAVTNQGSLFSGCTKLVGGKGTVYDANHTDGEYARIDGGEDAPGYLTGLFSITLPEEIEHGTLAASQGGKELLNGDKAITSSTVTLAVTPDKGYELETLAVTIVSENEPNGAPAMRRLRGGTIQLTAGDEPNTYTFEMPAAPVEVNVTFKRSDPTAIDGVYNDKNRNGQRYNILGQPVDDNYKGVVIEKGRKVLVK